jgi:hypothetical protein
MTVEHGVIVLLGLLIACARVAAWRACRTPLGRVNYVMARARERRRS